MLLEFTLLLWLGLEQSKDAFQNRHIGIIPPKEKIMRIAVRVGMHQKRPAGFAIAPGTADFLVISFNAPRQGGVNNRADVRLVDSHAEGNCRHNDLQLARQEILLHLLAALRIQSGVVGGRRVVSAKLNGHGFRLLAGGRVDDRRTALRVGQEFLGELGTLRRSNLHNFNRDVGAAEAVNEARRFDQRQLLHDVVLHGRCGGGGQSNHRRGT